ncbi:hypothetical protein MMC16_004470 [Acarospora aff. strigata]|nr:hypothetical protein [Acarospora aff. strigata]
MATSPSPSPPPQPLPPNVHVSRHPCLRAKLSQLRSHRTNARETKALVHEIALIVGCQALERGLDDTNPPPNPNTSPPPRPLPRPNDPRPGRILQQPSVQAPLLYPDPYALNPHAPPTPSNPTLTATATVAIILDPLIATGGTSAAAIQTLREWGVCRIMLLCVLGSETGVRRAAGEWREGVEIWVGGVDASVDARGMVLPGLGDVGDRLFLTGGK